MRRLGIVVAALVLGMMPAVALADDEARVSSPFARVGDRVVIELEVSAPHDAVVEVDPGDEAWEPVEIIDVTAIGLEAKPGGVVHRLAVTVAIFEPGELAIAPAVLVIGPSAVERRELPVVQVTVTSILRPGDPLELSPLPGPERIGGAQSPWLIPGIVAGAGLGIALVLAAGMATVAAARRWWRSRPAPVESEAAPLPDVAVVESLMETDAVRAYRELARSIRAYLGAEYGFPARALTTEELQQRMQRAGVDHWVARMTRDLLAECDAVVYAGYRPAPERRVGDLRVAREILGVES